MSLKCKFDLLSLDRRQRHGRKKLRPKKPTTRSDFKQWFDFLEVSHDRAKMGGHRRGGLLVSLTHKQIENAQVFAALAVIALAVDHRTIRQKSADPVHAPQGIEKKRIARGRRQRFVE